MIMENYIQKVNETTDFLKKKLDVLPEIGLLTGTGLGKSADTISNRKIFEYSEIPGFPVSTVESHAGKLIFGEMAEKNIVAMQGRFHLYEGYSPLEVTFPIRVMQQLGVKVLIVSNASGGLNLSFSPGDIMLVTDHINLTGENPLVGRNEDSWGLRFPDMAAVYDKRLGELAEKAAAAADAVLRKGVYAGLKGPSLETPAEMRFLRTIGADAVGFSTVVEAIAAVHGGMRVLGLSTITNINDPDNPEKASIEGIIDVAEKASEKLERIIRQVVKEL